MQQAGYGRIVSISSEAGRVGSKGSAVYSAAKGGIVAFTKAIARENARYGVTANAIAPGPIETPLLMGAKEFGEIGEKVIETMKSSTQMGRLGQPEEVAAAVAFLASDDATYVTGETLGVSGGLGMVYGGERGDAWSLNRPIARISDQTTKERSSGGLAVGPSSTRRDCSRAAGRAWVHPQRDRPSHSGWSPAFRCAGCICGGALDPDSSRFMDGGGPCSAGEALC